MLTQPPLLLPTPRSLTLTGGEARVPDSLAPAVQARLLDSRGHKLPTAHDTRLQIIDARPPGRRGREHYLLSISADAGGEAAVRILAHRHGVRHALSTLTQLLRQYPTSIPCMEIDDSPAFPTRGVMLDVSRDKVPTTAFLRQAIDLFAELKFNHLQLYTEHTFAYAGHEAVWRDASPITPAEARELDTYAASRGIALAANQNCFGHLAAWLKLPQYNHLAEIEGDAEWKFLEYPRRGPFSLCPTLPESEHFVRDLISQLAPCFNSPLLNIGCDETFDVGWGRSKAAVDDRGRAAVYFEFVRTIADIAHAYGKRTLMWADIALSHPEMLHLMPEGAIGLAWGYEPDAAFAEWCERLRDAGHEVWVCPGTSSWRSIAGRTTERRANITRAASEGHQAGATGFLITDWGDAGHHQHWPIALNAIAHAAEAAWNPSRAESFDPRAASLHALDDASLTLAPYLDELGDLDLDLRRTCRVPRNKNQGVRNATALFTHLHPPVNVPDGWNPEQLVGGHGLYVQAPLAAFEDVQHRLADLARRAPSHPDPLITAELAHTLDYLRYAADHAVSARTSLPFADAPSLRDRCQQLTREHERLWLLRNRPGGLSHSSSCLQRTAPTAPA